MLHVYFPHAGEERFECEREIVRNFDASEAVRLPDSDRRIEYRLTELEAVPLPGGPVALATFGDLFALLRACSDALEVRDDSAKQARAAEKQKIADRYKRERDALRDAAKSNPQPPVK